MVKVVEEESISVFNNVTAGTFSHTSNIQRENANAVFTSENLDKSDELAYALKDWTNNNAEYYESYTATASDSQGDPTCDPKTFTHTSNGK